jgi:hypothetical protein
MIQPSIRQSAKPLALLALALLLIVAGCGSSTGTAPKGSTAKVSQTIAQSALSTMAPDAKLLLVQTAEAVTATSTPVWGYLFGSPTDNKTYIVYVTAGEVLSASEYGTAGFSADEWSSVPGTGAWKIDSDVAYEKALAVSGAKGTPSAYEMGILTYVPPSWEDSATTKAFVWNVMFEPGASGATTGVIEVDAASGAAIVR